MANISVIIQVEIPFLQICSFNIFPMNIIKMVLNAYTILLEKNMVFSSWCVLQNESCTAFYLGYQRLQGILMGCMWSHYRHLPEGRHEIPWEPWLTQVQGVNALLYWLTNSWENRLHNRKRVRQSLRAWTHMRVIHLPLTPNLRPETRGTQKECLALCRHIESMILQYHKCLMTLLCN